MPRVTRAALRSQEGQEESDTAASVPLPLTPKPDGRSPLGETSGNIAAVPRNINTSEETMAAVQKGPGKNKKGNTTNKGTKPKKNRAGEPTIEVIEDENQSQTSSAAEEACKDLLQGDSASDANQHPVNEERPFTPLSAAVSEASLQLSPRHTIPRSNREQRSDVLITSESKTEKEDSFLANIDSRTPAKMGHDEGLDSTTAEGSAKEDSFVEQIKTRTPGKRISRIEDSVEALDALEEEIEMVGGLIPEARDERSPTTTKKQVKVSTNLTGRNINGSVRAKKNSTTPLKAKTTKATTSSRPAASRPSMQPPANKTISNMNDVVNQKRAATTRKPACTSLTSTEFAKGPLRKRVSSIHKAPFQPAKSTKPPTRADFELPGDAVARRLKEQREERLKREEEKKPEQPVFKARPARSSHAPEVKLTAATKARLSMAKGEPVNPTTTGNGARKFKPSVRTISVDPSGANKRLSTLSAVKRTSDPPAANSSARLTCAPSVRAAAVPRNPGASDAPRPAPTGKDLAIQKVKGKEVFGRTKVEIMEREKAKRDKDEAVKKARAEAAEKGRAASRDWAEKQKLRKLATAEADGEAMPVEA